MSGLMDLLLYCMQQLGVMFAVGAETIILLAFILAIRDEVIDSKEEHFARAVRKVLFFGIVLILISGAAITALELFAGHQATVFAPAYIFKICLIGLLAFFSLAVQGESLPEGLLEGFAGGTWYALFIVHILAPVAQWGQLIVLYVLWIVGFMVCWSALVFMMRGRVDNYAEAVNETPPVPRTPTPVPVYAPRAAPAPIQPLVPMRKSSPSVPTPARERLFAAAQPKAQSPSTPAPLTPTRAPAPSVSVPPMPPQPKAGEVFSLPTIRIMPKTPEDLQRQTNAMLRSNQYPQTK